jgi:hypothetical protein
MRLKGNSNEQILGNWVKIYSAAPNCTMVEQWCNQTRVNWIYATATFTSCIKCHYKNTCWKYATTISYLYIYAIFPIQSHTLLLYTHTYIFLPVTSISRSIAHQTPLALTSYSLPDDLTRTNPSYRRRRWLPEAGEAGVCCCWVRAPVAEGAQCRVACAGCCWRAPWLRPHLTLLEESAMAGGGSPATLFALYRSLATHPLTISDGLLH